MWFQKMRANVRYFSETGNTDFISGITISDIFITSMDFKLYNVLNWLQQFKDNKELETAVTVYFKQKLLESEIDDCRYIFSQFQSFINWDNYKWSIEYCGLDEELIPGSIQMNYLASIGYYNRS